MFLEFYVFGFSEESTNKIPDKVYIFLLGESRAIQNCVNQGAVKGLKNLGDFFGDLISPKNMNFA